MASDTVWYYRCTACSECFFTNTEFITHAQNVHCKLLVSQGHDPDDAQYNEEAVKSGEIQKYEESDEATVVPVQLSVAQNVIPQITEESHCRDDQNENIAILSPGILDSQKHQIHSNISQLSDKAEKADVLEIGGSWHTEDVLSNQMAKLTSLHCTSDAVDQTVKPEDSEFQTSKNLSMGNWPNLAVTNVKSIEKLELSKSVPEFITLSSNYFPETSKSASNHLPEEDEDGHDSEIIIVEEAQCLVQESDDVQNKTANIYSLDTEAHQWTISKSSAHCSGKPETMEHDISENVQEIECSQPFRMPEFFKAEVKAEIEENYAGASSADSCSSNSRAKSDSNNYPEGDKGSAIRGRPLYRKKDIHGNYATVYMYSCPVCSLQVKLKVELYKHIMKYHKQYKPLKCDFCSIGFLMRSDLNKHIKNHIGERPFDCKLCKKRFIRKYHLKRHIENCCCRRKDF